MKSKKLKLSIAKILTVVSIVGMMGVAIGPKLGLEVYQVHAEGPGDGIDDEKNENCLTQKEAVKLVKDKKNYSLDGQGNSVFTIPDNYDSIAPNAFNFSVNKGLENCEKWKYFNTTATYCKIIKLGSKVEKIGEKAFAYCNMHKIVLSEGIKSIGEGAFYSARRLTEITIPKDLTSIPEKCFAYCKKLEKVNFVNSANIKSIGGGAFSDCLNISEFTIPENLTSIPPYCFSYCKKLEKVNFVNPANIKSIGAGAFRGTKLSEITIPENMNSIPPHFFSGWKNLEKINFVNSANIKSIGREAFVDTKLSEFTIPESVDSIPEFCFHNCKALEKINFANSENIKSIEDCAFSGCSRMQKFTIPINIGSISCDCFRDCSALEEINFTNSNNIKSIEDCAFYGCRNLKKFTIPENVETISHACFCDCKSLQLKIPDNIKNIEPYSLVNCKKISEGKGNLILGKNIKSFSLDSFSGTGVNSIEVLGQNLNFTITYDSFDDGPLPQIVYFSEDTVVTVDARGQLGEQITRIIIPAYKAFILVPQE